MSARRVLLAACVVIVAAGAVVVAVKSRTDSDPTTVSDELAAKPNIVTIMTDDQDIESMRVMTNVNQLLGGSGVTFDNNVVSFPVCCPSRATYFTGQYAHNNNVLSNRAPYGGYDSYHDQDTAFPAALQKAGYNTAHIGKYLNNYHGTSSPSPEGWTEWHGSVDPSTYQYFGYTLMSGDTPETYGTKPTDYQADVYRKLAVNFINRQRDTRQPFFLNIAFLAPHVQGEEGPADESATGTGDVGSPVPAPRHVGLLKDEPLPMPPSFNEEDMSDKPAELQQLPLMSPDLVAKVTDAYHARLESLLSVDEAVAGIVNALRNTGKLDHTVIVFTSDNGYFQGEHRIPAGKGAFYEPSIRVPLVIRGPGVTPGVHRAALSANVDLAPTLLDFAGVKPRRAPDGRSLVPMLTTTAPDWQRDVLLERPIRNDFGVRTDRYLYVEPGTGEQELYDLVADPDELDNRAGAPELADVQAQLAARVGKLQTCAGATCQ